MGGFRTQPLKDRILIKELCVFSAVRRETASHGVKRGELNDRRRPGHTPRRFYEKHCHRDSSMVAETPRFATL